MIDEKSLRRPDFDPESVPVEWPDGSIWYLPKPRLVYRRGRIDGRTVAKVGRTWGVDYDRLVERVGEAKDDTGLIAALFDLAADLLLRNYDLSDEQLDELLTFDVRPGADDWPEPWPEVYRLALSLPPKASGLGPSQASSPTGSTPTA